MSKKALLVGINNFSRPSWQLHGCVNDTLAMQRILQSYYGFCDQDIRILHDRDATAQGIREALQWLLSEYQGAGNDVRVFHFSSHGTQVEDQDKDEWECKDEVIVPYDHDWDSPFRDDELRQIFADIPNHVNFTFIADCCHSGSIQRVLQESDIIFYPRYLTPPTEVVDRITTLCNERDARSDDYVAAHLPELLQGVPATQWATKMTELIPLLRERFRAEKYGVVSADRHVLLAACEDVQTAADARIEGEFRGAFTWALSRAIQESNGDLTYEELITRASANLQHFDQKPQLECPAPMRAMKLFRPLTEMHMDRVFA